MKAIVKVILETVNGDVVTSFKSKGAEDTIKDLVASYLADGYNFRIEQGGSMIYDKRHGGPYDRGSADKYYYRPAVPHYYVGDTGMSERIECDSMTAEQINDYMAGYREQMETKEYY